jgi:hypothetical protein
MINHDALKNGCHERDAVALTAGFPVFMFNEFCEGNAMMSLVGYAAEF